MFFFWCDVSLAYVCHRKRGGKYTTTGDQKKRALLDLCDETTHSYERKTNGSKKRARSFAIKLLVLNAQIYRDAFARTKYVCRETKRFKQFSLLCFLLFFFVLCEIFFLNLPHKKRRKPTPKKGLNTTKMASCAQQHQLLSSTGSFRERVGKTSSSASSSCSTSFSSPSSRGRRGRRAAISYAESSSSSGNTGGGIGLKTKSDISNIFDEAKVATETTFWGKLSAAYRIFFPPSEADTARAEAKKRLRMILVADRCTMSDQSMEEMKQKIIDVVEQYVEVDEDVPVDVKVKDDVKFGTVYGITVPVSKVKAEFDAENEAYMIGAQFVYDDETWEELKQETEEEEEEED